MASSGFLHQFYKRRAAPNKRDRYGYDKDGNLEERNKEGETVATYALPTYRPLHPDEKKQLEEERNLAIAEATDMYQKARLLLHQEYQRADRSEESILKQNMEVMRADVRLQRARFPIQFVEKEEDVVIRDLDFNQPNEVRKFAYSVAIMQHSPFRLQDIYVRAEESPDKPLISVAEAKRAPPTIPILFSDIDHEHQPYGFLALNYKVLIQLKDDTKKTISFPSARHALLAKMALEFKDEENYKTILSTETPEQLVYSVKNTPGGEENQERWTRKMEKWLVKVTIEKFKQHPELLKRLKETSPALLGAYEPADEQIGIGIDVGNRDAQKPKKWKGNLLGKTLMTIRDGIEKKKEEKAEEKKEEKKEEIPISAARATSTSDGTPSTPIGGPEKKKKKPIMRPLQPISEKPIEASSSAVPFTINEPPGIPPAPLIADIEPMPAAIAAAPVAAQPINQATVVAAPVVAPETTSKRRIPRMGSSFKK